MEVVLDELKKIDRQHYSDASIYIPAHVLIRKGTFLHVQDSWPFNFYSKVRMPDGILVLMVNIHLCEIDWTTPDDDIENKYRIRNLTNMLRHLATTYDLTKIPAILAGDFNTFSHHDKDMFICTCTNDEYLKVYKQLYSKNKYISKTLESFGFYDSWNVCHPWDNKSDAHVSWPVPNSCISNNSFLQSEIHVDEVPGRIDFIFTNQCLQSDMCEMTYTPENWYSDHKAILATCSYNPAIDDCNSRLDVDKLLDVDDDKKLILEVQVESGSSVPKWKLTAVNLSGEKNHYIDIRCIKEGEEPLSVGWFYVDGLMNVHENDLLLVNHFYHSTFDPRKEIDVSAQWKAVLFNESQEELLS